MAGGIGVVSLLFLCVGIVSGLFGISVSEQKKGGSDLPVSADLYGNHAFGTGSPDEIRFSGNACTSGTCRASAFAGNVENI